MPRATLVVTGTCDEPTNRQVARPPAEIRRFSAVQASCPLPSALQSKLLNVIEYHQVLRLGSTRSEAINFWIVAATSVDLYDAMPAWRFREHLYHRLAVLTPRLQPLRERGEDNVLLAEH